MKGLIFTEFFDMVGNVFSPEMVENIIEDAKLPNKGAYTDVGTYDHQELIRLVTALSQRTKMSIPDLELTYGKYLFTQLKKRYGKLIQQANNTFDFLWQVDKHIHVEVLKLYPEAELPRFNCTDLGPNAMSMTYHSNHPFEKLAEGLILGCAESFGDKIHIESKNLGPSETKNNFLFTITMES